MDLTPSELESSTLRDASLDGLPTEAGGAPWAAYDARPTEELVQRMSFEDAVVPEVVRAASAQIASVVDAVAERLAGGGRLVYAGAGSSGRIAALDASECESTFSTVTSR